MNQYFEQGISSEQYSELMETLANENRSTGEDQSEARIHYTKLNRQRMRRLSKTIELSISLKEAIAAIDRPMKWLVITESWCGDSAQNIPAIQKIASASELIELKFVFRDESHELMNEYLTNGAKSIPKLVAFDADSGEELFTWGPRPIELAEYRKELIAGGLDAGEINELLQRWYLSNREKSIMAEFTDLLRAFGTK